MKLFSCRNMFLVGSSIWTISNHGVIVQGLVTQISHQRQSTALSFGAYVSKQQHGRTQLYAGLGREEEIRRKITLLKRQGKIKKQEPSSSEPGTRAPVAEQYGRQVMKKLGSKKAQLLGQTVSRPEDDENDDVIAELDQDEEVCISGNRRQVRLGTLPKEAEQVETVGKPTYTRPFSSSSADQKQYNNFDASLFEDDEDEEAELSEQALLELVASKMQEKQQQEQKEREAKIKDDARSRLAQLREESQELSLRRQDSGGKTTTGIGGSWIKSNETSPQADYKPSRSGTWGVFERPKDISRAFGGGKRVGAGYTPEEINKKKSEEDTRARLREYREKVGIEVQSEKDHSLEIDDALVIARRAMERGMYGTAVSALEKVTKWCSSNSVVGGKVFLELAMAYEAVGRTQEAVAVYTALSKSRIEETKYNAKRLLYNFEAMQFMQNEARSPEFSRKKIRNTFIDTTGLANIAQNFDDVYNTAYIDLDAGYYKRLTESVVRSSREARQILLKATGAGEVSRLKIVQALRSISRHFDDALEEEIELNKPAPEPVALLDGKPILAAQEQRKVDDMQRRMNDMNDFTLLSAEQMKENLSGKWRLQLLADKRGDGVKYYNTSMSWQEIDTKSGRFSSLGTAGFLTVEQSGGIEFQSKRRILKRTDLKVSGGMLTGFLANTSGGAPGAVSMPHQIVSVDSVLLITRMAAVKSTKLDDSTKEYFAVWRRMDS